MADRQSEAYRENPINEHIQDVELGAWMEMELPPITGLQHVRLPEDFERDGWDRGREEPKSLAEARGDLFDRITDPRAPDGPESEGAYDDLED